MKRPELAETPAFAETPAGEILPGLPDPDLFFDELPRATTLTWALRRD